VVVGVGVWGFGHFEALRLAQAAFFLVLAECACFLAVEATCDAAATLTASMLAASRTSSVVERRRCTASQSAGAVRALTPERRDWPKCREQEAWV
jgi:hypothetical protein